MAVFLGYGFPGGLRSLISGRRGGLQRKRRLDRRDFLFQNRRRRPPELGSSDGIKDAVHKYGGIIAAEPAGDLDRLIDDDGWNERFFFEHFVNRGPEDVPIDQPHPGYPPVFGCALNETVDLLPPRDDSPDQPGGIGQGIGVGERFFRSSGQDGFRIGLIVFEFE